MRFIDSVIEKLQRHPKRIVFTEGHEPRIIQAARQFHSKRMGAPILLGDRTRIKEAALRLSISLEGIRIINPAESEDLEQFAQRFEVLRRYKGLKGEEALEAMKQPHYFGAMMVACNFADGLVGGADVPSGNLLRPVFQIIKKAPNIRTASSAMVMQVYNCDYGDHGVFFFADCGVIPDPSLEQLADIAISTSQLCRQLTGKRPRVAMLSYSTKGSASGAIVERVAAATALARQKAQQLEIEVEIDGELQADAAIDPAVAEKKMADSMVAGYADVLIFPDLNSGNIATKLIQRLARADAFGQILIGLEKPVADLSRGCSAHDILGVAAIVGCQAIEYRRLYPA